MLSPMRRLERAVSDGNHVLEIIQSCDCCRVAFSEPDGPYIVPMNFGIESSQEGQMALCFHRASSGKKVELMQKNPCVGFEMDTGHVLVPGAQACSCSFLYQSVIGKGKIEAISNSEEKKHGLTVLMKHDMPEKEWDFPSAMLERTAVFLLDVTEWSCKEHSR